jgi:adenosylmethionine-8-amino-7-oxononanoate aminotransferase
MQQNNFAQNLSAQQQNSHVFPRHTKHHYEMAVKGDGVYIIDDNGKRYLDGASGAAVSCLGHSNQRVIAAIKRQIDSISYAHSSVFTTTAAEELATLLCNETSNKLNHVYFVSGGSEAMEAALKMARQYFVESGEMQRKHIIARDQSYHGNTLGALAVGGNRWRRQAYEPLLIDVTHVSACYPYRGKIPGETDESYASRLVQELEQAIEKLGGENIIAFVAETVGGATIGCTPPVVGYFKKIRALCDKHGILLILDEVMCGMGRCGSLFAYDAEDISPDILAIAKGLGAGYQPIGAVMTSTKIYSAFYNGSGFFQHGHTYMAHATACAAALEVQKIFAEENLLQSVNIRAKQLENGLRERLSNHHYVGDIRGRGLFWAVELVEERAQKTPFSPAVKAHEKIQLAAREKGLICYAMGGTINGKEGNHVMLMPPFIISESELEWSLDQLAESIKSAL